MSFPYKKEVAKTHGRKTAEGKEKKGNWAVT